MRKEYMCLTTSTRNQVGYRQHGSLQKGLRVGTMLLAGGCTLANLKLAVVPTMAWHLLVNSGRVNE